MDTPVQPITRHTERFCVALTGELYEEFGLTAARERDRRASLSRAAKRIASLDGSRYSLVGVERAGASYRLRAGRPIEAVVIPLPLPGDIAPRAQADPQALRPADPGDALASP